MTKRIEIHHFAQFRDARGTDRETVTTEAPSPRALYDELGLGAVVPLSPAYLCVAVNDAFAGWDHALEDGDAVVFMTPMAGG